MAEVLRRCCEELGPFGQTRGLNELLELDRVPGPNMADGQRLALAVENGYLRPESVHRLSEDRQEFGWAVGSLLERDPSRNSSPVADDESFPFDAHIRPPELTGSVRRGDLHVTGLSFRGLGLDRAVSRLAR